MNQPITTADSRERRPEQCAEAQLFARIGHAPSSAKTSDTKPPNSTIIRKWLAIGMLRRGGGLLAPPARCRPHRALPAG